MDKYRVRAKDRTDRLCHYILALRPPLCYAVRSVFHCLLANVESIWSIGTTTFFPPETLLPKLIYFSIHRKSFIIWIHFLHYTNCQRQGKESWPLNMKELEELITNKREYYQPVLVVSLPTVKIKEAKQRKL